MGKTRGHGKKYKGGGARKQAEDDESSDEEVVQLGGQNANVGMLPPSDSDEDDDEEPAPKVGQNPNAGLLPPSDDEDEEEETEEESEEDDKKSAPKSEQPVATRRSKVDDPDPEQIRKDMERLEMIKKKREDDRLKRIAEEGWDRYAPESETNRRPDSVPKQRIE